MNDGFTLDEKKFSFTSSELQERSSFLRLYIYYVHQEGEIKSF